MKKKDTILYGFVINERTYEVERIKLTLEDFITIFNGGTLHDSNPDSDTYGEKLETPKIENTFVFWKEKQREHNAYRWERNLEDKLTEELRTFTAMGIQEYPRNAELSLSYSKVLPLQRSK